MQYQSNPQLEFAFDSTIYQSKYFSDTGSLITNRSNQFICLEFFIFVKLQNQS